MRPQTGCIRGCIELLHQAQGALVSRIRLGVQGLKGPKKSRNGDEGGGRCYKISRENPIHFN